MKKSKLATILAAITLTAGVAVAASGSADAAPGDKHFILITTKAAPRWKGDAQVFDANGNQVDNFKQPLKSGGRKKWEFTDPGNGRISFKLGDGNDSTLVGDRILATDRDHCFVIGAAGNARYTGDSLTGGCTPD
jgi:hypothetical protein